jgi:hypothetical protein
MDVQIVMLEDKDILQSNATVIAGALIFITISYVATSHTAPTGLVGIALALGIIVNFGLSSFLIIAGKRRDAIFFYKIRIYVYSIYRNSSAHSYNLSRSVFNSSLNHIAYPIPIPVITINATKYGDNMILNQNNSVCVYCGPMSLISIREKI